MNIKLSIVIPTYNPTSIFYSNINKLNQLCKKSKDTEIIIIDDYSNRKIKIDKNSHHGLTLIRNKKNYGPGFSRNIGIRKSNGEYILFLDSDDILANNSIKTIFKYLNEYKKVELFGYDHKLLINKKVINYNCSDKFFNNKNLILNNFLSSSTDTSAIFYVFKKSFLEDNNIFFKKGVHEDILFMFKVFFYVRKKQYINKTLYIKNNVKSSIINNIDTKRIIDYFNALKDINNFYIKNSDGRKYKLIKRLYLKGQSGYIYQIVYFICKKKLSYKKSINLLLFTYKQASKIFDLEKLPKKTVMDRIVDIYLNEIKYIYDKKTYQKFCEKINKNFYGKT